MSSINSSNQDTITDKQQMFEYGIFSIMSIGIILFTWTSYQQRRTKTPNANRNLLVATGWGYIITAISIFLLIPFAVNSSTLKIRANATNMQQLWDAFNKIIIFPLPYTLTIGILAYAASLNFVYMDRLVKHHVANDYFTWSSTFSFLLIIQAFLLIHYSMSKYTGVPSSLRYIIYLLSVFNTIVLGIMQTILHFFSTDG
jgi:hypothetical protein